MRTTLDVDDDVLAGTRALARERGSSVGAALSELAGHSLRARRVATERRVRGFTVDRDSPPSRRRWFAPPARIRDAA